MAQLQKYFIQFHETIKLNEENEELRDKRNIILKKLDDKLKELFEKKKEKVPSYRTFNQGSYAMHTGVKPVKGDYDIDLGIRFDINKDDYDDPVKVKQWVFDSLEGHTKSVTIKYPCVTVSYQKGKEPIYHVDLAIYANKDFDDYFYLAKGKPSSEKDNKIWEDAEPFKLIELISTRYSESEDNFQFRRCIRYMKRWKDIKFSSDGHSAPIGIGLTIAAYNWFIPYKTTNLFQNKNEYDDLKAIHQFITNLINRFSNVYFNNEYADRLLVSLPTKPYCDLFIKMSNKQMENFKDKLSTLRDKLKEAIGEVDTEKACKLLNTHSFGEDFPIPLKEETAEKKSIAITTSSTSA